MGDFFHTIKSGQPIGKLSTNAILQSWAQKNNLRSSATILCHIVWLHKETPVTGLAVGEKIELTVWHM